MTKTVTLDANDHLCTELRLESKLNASNSLVFMRTDLFPLIVKAPSTAPFDTLTQIAAQMGRDITVTMKQVRVSQTGFRRHEGSSKARKHQRVPLSFAMFCLCNLAGCVDVDDLVNVT